MYALSLLLPRLLRLRHAFAVLARVMIPAQTHLILAPAARAPSFVLPIAHALSGRGGSHTGCLGTKVFRQIWCVLGRHTSASRRNSTTSSEETCCNLCQRRFHLGPFT